MDAHARERQRRFEGVMEYSKSLPPPVVTVLTQCDSLEEQREGVQHKSHNKLTEIIARFFAKLLAEEKKFKARMEELKVR